MPEALRVPTRRLIYIDLVVLMGKIVKSAHGAGPPIGADPARFRGRERLGNCNAGPASTLNEKNAAEDHLGERQKMDIRTLCDSAGRLAHCSKGLPLSVADADNLKSSGENFGHARIGFQDTFDRHFG